MEKEPKSRITTEEQLMSLKQNDIVYIVNRTNVRAWKCLVKMPYRTMQRMAFYNDTDFMQLSIYQLNQMILIDHDEAYQHLAENLRDYANHIETIDLKK